MPETLAPSQNCHRSIVPATPPETHRLEVTPQTLSNQERTTPDRPLHHRVPSSTPRQIGEGQERHTMSDLNRDNLNPKVSNQGSPISYSGNDMFAASESEMKQVCLESYDPTATIGHSKLTSSLRDCFGDEHFDYAWEFVNIFVHHILDCSGGDTLHELLTRALDTLHPTHYDPTSDDSSLMILLQSGREWLSSQSANNDVRELDAYHRSLLYQIGSVVAPNEEDELQGKTFVPTRDVSNIIAVLEKLFIFLYRSQWSGMKTPMDQIQLIYETVSMFDSMLIADAKEDDIIEEVVKRVVDTNIIPGLIMAITLQQPTTPNGRSIISDFIAARSIKKDRDGNLRIRSPNKISKETNQLLRLSRHGASSHYNRVKRRMSMSGASDSDFRQYTQSSIAEVQKSQNESVDSDINSD